MNSWLESYKMYRFTASPTRDLSISDLRIALINYICAKQSDKLFIVRMEDIDKAKNIESKDAEILDILSIFGLNYDYLYYQSENFKYHLQLASSLMDKGLAFACFCKEDELQDGTCAKECNNISQEELLNNNLPFTIRLKNQDENFLIMSQQKYPTANFANACDDMLQGITHIIKEDAHILDTPRQELIRVSLGYTQDIKYSHLPTLINEKDDTSSVKWLLNQGFLPEAIVNYLLLLGNTPPKEIFTQSEAIEWLKLDEISKTPLKFDIKKLKAINAQHIMMMPELELSKIIGYSSTDIGKLAKLYAKQVSTTFEIKEKIDGVFSLKTSQEYSQELDTLKQIVKNAPYFEKFEEFKNHLMSESKMQGENFFKTLRIMLTANENGLEELEEVYEHIKNYLLEIAR